MAILDDVLAGLVAGLKGDLTRGGLTRQRGGIARGVGWAEASGRGPDGSWLELRLHHRPSEHRLDAGLLAYQPLARGGRTVVVGERTLSYSYAAGEVCHVLADDVAGWLRRIGESAPAESDIPAASGF
ncbi:MAG: hypothetical protein IT305_14275 [Chloroflexi bacterium]|nr:hypothetical protein [Chloroflexota bacterium]